MSEKIDFTDDEKPVILVDEFADMEADDPTFGGIHNAARLEHAFPFVRDALREAYVDRFQNRPPQDDMDLFTEMNEELLLPHEALIHKLFRIMKEKESHTPEEEEAIIDIIEDFIEQLPRMHE